MPPDFMDTVVALGARETLPSSNPDVPPNKEWQTHGSGFFYGYAIPSEQHLYTIFLITARHVVDKNFGNPEGDPILNDLDVRLNHNGPQGRAQEFTIPVKPAEGSKTWFFHPERSIDVAICPMSFDFLKANNIEPKFIYSDVNAADTAKIRELGLAAGDGIFVLGFPMGITGKERNYVVVRQGSIANISELLDRGSMTFVLDTFVFPGNSGGPVVLRPEFTAITGTKPQPNSLLLGMVIREITYVDTAISQQTRRARITFEENSGLTEALPVDYINEAIKAWLQANPDFEESVKAWHQAHPATPASHQ